MKRTKAKFRVIGRLDKAGGAQVGTVTIDRSNNVVEVRPLRRRKTWLFTLDQLVDLAVQRQIIAELREKKREKAHKRGRRW